MTLEVMKSRLRSENREHPEQALIRIHLVVHAPRTFVLRPIVDHSLGDSSFRNDCLDHWHPPQTRDRLLNFEGSCIDRKSNQQGKEMRAPVERSWKSSLSIVTVMQFSFEEGDCVE